MNIKWIKIAVVLGALLIAVATFVPRAEASDLSTFNQTKQQEISKKVESIRTQVATKVKSVRATKVAAKKEEQKKQQAEQKKQTESKDAQKEQPAQNNTNNQQSVNKQAQQGNHAQPAQKQQPNKSANIEQPKQKSQNNNQPKSNARNDASQRGKAIGEKNREYGKRLSDPNLSQSERKKSFKRRLSTTKVIGRGIA